MGEQSGKTHVLKRGDAVKPGDVIKLVDDLSFEERLQLDDIRRLGDAKVLDEKASLLEDMAAAARHRANIRRRIDLHPWLEQEAPVVRPTYALAQLGLTAFCLCLLTVLCMQVWGRDRASATEAPSPTPSTQLENARPEPAGEPKRATRSRKGSAEVANVW